MHFDTMHCQDVQQGGEHLHCGLAVGVQVADHFTNEHRLMRTPPARQQSTVVKVSLFVMCGKCACLCVLVGIARRVMSDRLWGRRVPVRVLEGQG